MTNENGSVKLVLKVELEDKKLKVTFGDVPNTLLYDRAINLLKLEFENMLIQGTMKPPIIEVAPTGLIKKVNDIRSRIIGS